MAKLGDAHQRSLLGLPAGSSWGNGGHLSHSWEPLWSHVQHEPQSVILPAVWWPLALTARQAAGPAPRSRALALWKPPQL